MRNAVWTNCTTTKCRCWPAVVVAGRPSRMRTTLIAQSTRSKGGIKLAALGKLEEIQSEQ
eukprot:4067236-Amphidinium_carterae.1